LRGKSYATKARSKYGKARMTQEKVDLRMGLRLGRLAAALVMVCAALPSPALAQDAMSERYRSIRAPTDALVNRITRSRLQGDLNVLGREADRVRGQRRESERLGFQDPVSGLAARERALDARLDRIRTEQQASAARLLDIARGDPQIAVPALPTLRSADGPSPGPAQYGIVSAEEASAAARLFVDELLRANQARP